jgi:mono/diheme cytochrome c family protein
MQAQGATVMRLWYGVMLLASSACQQQVALPSKATGVAFDGAEVTNAAALRAHGERLTHVLGCTGCHGDHLDGAQFEPEKKQYGPLYASNLTVEVPEYTDAQLDGIIRNGVHPERRVVWAMPSQIFHNLSDPDFKALVAYLRSLKPVGRKLPPPQFNPLDRQEIASGKFKSAAQMVQEYKHAQPVQLGAKYALGRYITSVTCEECHGSDLAGRPGVRGKPPNLVVAGGYSRQDFERLITTGIPTGNRTLNPAMQVVATTRFSHLTRHERDALYGYLKARADRS